MISIGALPLLHDVVPSGDAFVAMLVLFGSVGLVARVVWRGIEILAGGKGLILAVLAGTLFVSLAFGIVVGDLGAAREIVFVVLGAFGLSAWESHEALGRQSERGGTGWLRGAGAFVLGIVVGMIVTELVWR